VISDACEVFYDEFQRLRKRIDPDKSKALGRDFLLGLSGFRNKYARLCSMVPPEQRQPVLSQAGMKIKSSAALQIKKKNFSRYFVMGNRK
jgi:hypothetical protein